MAFATQARELARLGAEVRIREMEKQISQLRQHYKLYRPSTSTNGTKPKRKGHRMTAAQRRAVGKRMKAYWAEFRKSKAD